MMVHHHHAVDGRHFFLPIKPTFMGRIVMRFVDFDESPIDNATLKL